METNVHAPYPNQDLVTRSPRAFLHVKTPSRSFETARPVARVSALGEGFGTPNRPPDPLDRQTGRDHPLPVLKKVINPSWTPCRFVGGVLSSREDWAVGWAEEWVGSV